MALTAEAGGRVFSRSVWLDRVPGACDVGFEPGDPSIPYCNGMTRSDFLCGLPSGQPCDSPYSPTGPGLSCCNASGSGIVQATCPDPVWGHHCNQDDECPVGSACVPIGHANNCSPYCGAVGMGDTPCCDGLTRKAGVCLLPDGHRCNANEECASGTCLGRLLDGGTAEAFCVPTADGGS
jgi:hypothetical protein